MAGHDLPIPDDYVADPRRLRRVGNVWCSHQLTRQHARPDSSRNRAPCRLWSPCFTLPRSAQAIASGVPG